MNPVDAELHSCGNCNNKAFTRPSDCSQERKRLYLECASKVTFRWELVIASYPEAQVRVLPGDLVEKGNSKRAEGCAPKAEAEMAC